MASRTKLLTELSVTDLWKGVKDPETVWSDLAQEPKRALQLLLQNRMHDELTTYLHAGRYIREHSRRASPSVSPAPDSASLVCAGR